MENPCITLAFVDPGLRKAPFFLELRRWLEPQARCLYYSRRPIVRGYVRSTGAPLFPARTDGPRREYDISDAELRLAVGRKELVLREAKALRNARWLLAEIADFFDREKVDAVLVWNGSNLRGALAAYLARRRGLPVIYAEHGYLPGTTQLDLQGVNFDSSMSAAAHRGEATLSPEPALDRLLDEEIARYKEGRPMRVMSPELPQAYRRDPRTRLRRKLVFWFKRRARLLAANLGADAGGVRPALPERFVLLPFQVRKDSQLVLHSPLLGNDMASLLAAVDAALRKVDPALRIVAKLHPYEHAAVQHGYRELPRRYPQVLFLGHTPMTQLLPRAEAVVTINSIVGFEAMLYDKPVVALGRNFYTVPGLVECVERLDDLPDALCRALTQPPDAERRRAFLRYVYARFLSFGSYHDFSERSQRAVATRITELLGLPTPRESPPETVAEPVAALLGAG